MKSHPRHPCPLYTPFFIHSLPKCRFFRSKQAELQTASQLFQNDPAANTAGFHPMGSLESTTQGPKWMLLPGAVGGDGE